MLHDIAPLRFLREQIRAIEKDRLKRLKDAPATPTNVTVPLLDHIFGVGIETADILANEILSRNLRDRRAVARYAGLTGSPDENGNRRREKGLARAGDARVRHTMIQLAWRFLRFHPNSELAKRYNKRAADGRSSIRKTMIVALARKLLIVLWRMVATGEAPRDLKLLRCAAA
jgi:transposase